MPQSLEAAAEMFKICKMLQMVQNAGISSNGAKCRHFFKWCEMVQMVQNGSNGTKWCEMVQMVRNGAKWFKWFKWCKMPTIF